MPRTRITQTISRAPEVVAALAAHPDYPGPSAILDAADRRWLREHGTLLDPREEPEPLHVRAMRARAAKKAAARADEKK